MLDPDSVLQNAVDCAVSLVLEIKAQEESVRLTIDHDGGRTC